MSNTTPAPNDSQNQLWYKIVLQAQTVFGVTLDPAPQPSDTENTSADNLLKILNETTTW